MPTLFQNSYRIPLHYKNVYYYKSLVNLNMRLMALKKNKTLTVKDNNDQDLNSMSLSCPNLQMKQVLVMKDNQRPKKNSDQHTTADLNRSRLEAKKSSKILNAGSIVLMTTAGQNATGGEKSIEVGEKKSKKSALKSDKTNKITDKEQKVLVEKPSLVSLVDYTDKIPENASKKNILMEDEGDEDEEDDSEENSVDDDDAKKNCLLETKIGKLLYRFVYKPVFKPMKYVLFSLVENLKLFLIFKFSVFALCNFVLSFFYESPFFFINSYMIKNDLSPNQAGTIHVGVGVTSVLASSI